MIHGGSAVTSEVTWERGGRSGNVCRERKERTKQRLENEEQMTLETKRKNGQSQRFATDVKREKQKRTHGRTLAKLALCFTPSPPGSRTVRHSPCLLEASAPSPRQRLVGLEKRGFAKVSRSESRQVSGGGQGQGWVSSVRTYPRGPSALEQAWTRWIC